MSGIDNRKDVLLLLLYLPSSNGELAEPILGKTRLMKLIFLLGREKEIDKKLQLLNWYEFKAYDYGPFSSQLFDDIDFLRNVGLITSSSSGLLTTAEAWEDEQALEEALLDPAEAESEGAYEQDEYALTELGIQFVQNNLLSDPNLTSKIKADIESIKKNEGSLTLSSLLKYVYNRYPDVAEESKLQKIRS